MRDGLHHLLVVDVAIVRAVDGQAETVGIAGGGEQFARAFGVKGLGLHFRVVAEHAFGHDLAGGDGSPLHQAFDQRLAVDGLGNRLPHAQVFQRIVLERATSLVGDQR